MTKENFTEENKIKIREAYQKRAPIFLVVLLLFSSCKYISKNESNEDKLIFNEGVGVIENIKACSYNDLHNENRLVIYEPDSRGLTQINTIMDYTGLPSNFEVYKADVENALATTVNGNRYIIYDNRLLDFVDNYSKDYWSSMSILAHEIGHHLGGHTLDFTGSNHRAELEADEYSGSILFKMGATLEQAKSAMKLLANEFSSLSHPSKQARLLAIEKGWERAANTRYESAIPPPPNNEQVFSRVGVKSEFYKEDLLPVEALEAPNYGQIIKNLDKEDIHEGIIIDVEEEDPSDGAWSANFDQPSSDFFKVLTIHITKSTDSDYSAGKRIKFHLMNYNQSYSAAIGSLESLLVPGRKIRFKDFYYGYGASDLYYIKHLPRD